MSPLFDIYRDHNQRHEVHNVSLNRYDLGDSNILINGILYIINNSKYTQSESIQPSTIRADKPPDYASHIPDFSGQSVDVIKRTFDATTPYVRAPMSTLHKLHYRSPSLALNVNRSKESVATDTI